MKKKMLALIMVLLLVFAMAAFAGCSSSSDADTTSSTETEALDDTEDVSGEGADVVDDMEEETTDVSEKETPEDETSESGNVSNEDEEELCNYIREAIINDYLTPNNLSTEDFNWPSEDSFAWTYFGALTAAYSTSLAPDGEPSDTSTFESVTPSPDKEIINAAFTGTVNWFESTDYYDSADYTIVLYSLHPFETTIPTKITFE